MISSLFPVSKVILAFLRFYFYIFLSSIFEYLPEILKNDNFFKSTIFLPLFSKFVYLQHYNQVVLIKK